MIQTDKSAVHTIACVGIAGALLEGIAHSLVEQVQHLGGSKGWVVGHNVAQQQIAYDGEQGTRHTVTCAVHNSQVGDVANMIEPRKVATDHILGSVEHEGVWEETLNFVLLGQEGKLDTLGVVDTTHDVLFGLLSLLFQLFDFGYIVDGEEHRIDTAVVIEFGNGFNLHVFLELVAQFYLYTLLLLSLLDGFEHTHHEV